MRIAPRMGVTISGLALAGATVMTLGTAGSASAQSTSIAPRHAVTGYSVVDRHRRWRHGGYTYTYEYYWWGCGCCCCC
ncbi:hypothetical protein [Actinoallomurus iriomotensis]|uniref:Uncharacterized protein n=1 Tax=Actinoallomurus iriomotensis TaxID=478107 RepID=A0A9W6SG53_9ACTN|nr:hypothetical protein [Actinoallomurus iriomotensis]GLY92260.1 hypothetical protein Airi02_101880 [Actinoallomurus iriomotensis]